ncbi:hypothetical protein AWC31_00075 [Mycolicibacterium wolinskyi]|uniref:Uncharacterized protein n=1 Tax=Mycolicibacterium wolinskyi TaxID=59750 RepID=A0A132PQM7_9MYCO|nr:hypothetical protein AFM11_08150 [Mycolicibacterium wolinskyi]ORX19295.1 hypothetical protein AWC31_00075 [Mycolicibacterium wolinskyi]
MLEERRAGDAAVVGTHHPRARRGRELLAVAVPRRPTGTVGVHQHHGVGGFDRRLIGAGVQRVQPVDAEQPRVKRQRVEVGVLHPADRQVKTAVGDTGGLRVRRHHPRVHPQFGDARGPLGPIGRAPVHTADAHRVGDRHTFCAPA